MERVDEFEAHEHRCKAPSRVIRKSLLEGLPLSTMKNNGTVMTEIWCHHRKTGIIRLLLCLNWQAVFSGAGNDWKHNMQHVKDIFNAISAEPDL
jgi:hypothetical protein